MAFNPTQYIQTASGQVSQLDYAASGFVEPIQNMVGTKPFVQTPGAVGGTGTSPDMSNMSAIRMAQGKVPGAQAKPATPTVNFADSNTDWRIRVSLAGGCNILYNGGDEGILKPLVKSENSNGVIFPITPQVQMTHTAKYTNQLLTHSNYAMQFYEGSEVGQIQINGEFPVQNIEEGQYLLAVIYFFRACTKMFWGDDEIAGAPPPMLFLTGYGEHYFPNVPCVLTSFLHTMPEDKDFIDIPSIGEGGPTRLPTQSTIQIMLQPLYSRNRVKEFVLEDFGTGSLLGGGFV